MARTLVGTLVLRLQENISAGAGKVAGALNSLGATVDGLGKQGGGFSRLQTNAQKLERDLARLGSAPWGARMQSQLERLGTGTRDIERVRNEWDKLIASMNSRGLTKSGMSKELAQWRQSVIGHFTAVRAEAEQTKKSLANIWKPIGLVAGLGTATYATSRLGRAGIMASSEFERAKSRSYFAGLDGGEQTSLRDQAIKTSSKYKLGYGNTLDTITDAALNFGSVEKALKVADTLGAAQVYLSNLFGAQGAGDQLRQMTKALDTLEINDPARINKVVDGLIKAQSVEGKEFSPEQWAMAIRYGRAASRFFSDDFLTSRLPALVAETSGSDVGTMLQSLYTGFGTGRAPVEALKAQQRFGLRTGMEFNRRDKMTGRGGLINADEFRRDPISWIYNRAMPALRAHGVDTENDDQLAEALGSIVGQRTQGDLLTRAIRSQDQYERKRKEQYPKAKGLDAAKEVAEKDPFAAFQAFKNGVSNLGASVVEFANPAILGGLNNVSTAFHSLGAAVATLDISKINTFGAAAAGLVAVGSAGLGAAAMIKGTISMLAAGPALVQAAGALNAAAVALGASKGIPPVAPVPGGGATGGTGFWGMIAKAIIPAAATVWAVNEFGKSPEEAKKGRDKREAEQEAYRKRHEVKGAQPGEDPDIARIRMMKEELSSKKLAEASAGVDTSSIEGAGTKAKETASLITESLNVTARPTVDASSIAAARAEVEALRYALQQVGELFSGLKARANGLSNSYSDYGVTP